MTSAKSVGRVAMAYGRAERRIADWLARYSIDLLRISLGLVFLAFGVLKFVPGLSPAEPLATRTLAMLTFGLVPTQVGLIGVATLESVIGLLLLSGRATGLALPLLALALVGILSPLVLLPGEMFRGPLAPTLEGQYVMKDVIIVAAGLVLAAWTLGARLSVNDQRANP